jgi:hypothetical protein
MNTEEILFDNLLDTSVDGNVFLEDLIEDPAANVLEQAMKENMVIFPLVNICIKHVFLMVAFI